jgi:hypothetical protein
MEQPNKQRVHCLQGLSDQLPLEQQYDPSSFAHLFRDYNAGNIDALQSTVQKYDHDDMSPVSQVQMCNCAVLDPCLKDFVSVNTGHRFDKVEGDRARQCPEEEEADYRTGNLCISGLRLYEGYRYVLVREPSRLLK